TVTARGELFRECSLEVRQETSTVGGGGKSIEPRSQTCSAIPLDDGVDILHDVQVLGRPDIELARVRRQCVVVDLCRMRVPLTWGVRKVRPPHGRLANLSHG